MVRFLSTRRSILQAGLAAGCAWPAPAAPLALRLQGSTTFNSELMAEHREAIEAAAGVRLAVVANKSNLGLLALFDGGADLAMISTKLANEVDMLARARPDLPFSRLLDFEIARTRAALIVHPSNPVLSLSDIELRRVLTGEAPNWREFNGPDLPIRVVAVREGGGVVTTVEAAVLGAGGHIAAQEQIRVANGPQIVKVVEQERGALGITQVKLTQGRQVRELGTARPMEQLLFLVSLGEPTPVMRAVIEACRAAAIGRSQG